MKSTILNSDESSRKAQQYLDRVNHAPYLTISAWVIGIFCFFTLFLLIGVF
jgi:hypothetical protein